MTQNAPASHANKQIIGLDLIRFAAALLVMFHHYGWRTWAVNYLFDMNFHYLGDYSWFGFIGVQIFFVISGFVIAYSAEKATPASFVKSRLTRLYPAAWICTTVTVLVLFLTGNIHMPLGGHSVTEHFVQRWLGSMTLYPLGPWLDGAFWTLGIELGFYCVIYLALLTRNFRHLGAIMTVIGSISLLCMLFVILQSKAIVPVTPFTSRLALAFQMKPLFQVLLLAHGSLFGLGTLLWLCLFHRVTVSRIAGLIICFIGSTLNIRIHGSWSHWMDPNWIWKTPYAVWLTAVIAIVLSVRYNSQLHHVLGRRGARLARKLGVVTYPLYLVHQDVGYALFTVFKGRMSDLSCLFVVIAIVVPTAFLINSYLEEPLQHFLRNWLHTTGRVPVPAATVP